MALKDISDAIKKLSDPDFSKNMRGQQVRNVEGAIRELEKRLMDIEDRVKKVEKIVKTALALASR
jgi:hypothetical protein